MGLRHPRLLRAAKTIVLVSMAIVLLLPSTGSATSATTQTLTVVINGAGSGSVWEAKLGGPSCNSSCTLQYTTGTDVWLFATADYPGSVFTGWSGDCTGTGTCDVLMNGPHTITATFVPASTYPLFVSKTGTGAGTVTSSPAGIDAGTKVAVMV